MRQLPEDDQQMRQRNLGLLETRPTQASARYTNYVLVVLSITSFFNYLDRSIFSILAIPMQQDLDLSDAQVGLLGGFGFALFYATLGIPLARLADRCNRVTLLSICMAVWSAATAACGLAANFLQLLLARVGVGAGEAGCVPASYSILADYFPARRRAMAIGMFHFGGNLGLLVGLMVAGLLSEAIGWRASFILLGLPGVLFAVVLRWTVREQPRGILDAPVSASGAAPSLRTVLRRKAFLHLVAAYTLATGGFYSLLLWLPHFFVRNHHMQIAQLGTWYGLAMGGGLVIGVFVGAILATSLIARDRRWELWFPSLVTACALFFFASALLLPTPGTSLFMVSLGAIAFSMSLGPGLAAIQSLSEAPVRAVTSAVVLLASAIFGQGFFPTVTGIGSDALSPLLGAESLRYVLLGVLLTLAWSALHFFLGGRCFIADLPSSKPLTTNCA